MPGSDSANNSWVMQKLREIKPKRILDVGAGNGNFGQRVKSVFGDSVVVDAIEAWEPYIGQFNLQSKYNNVFNQDARLWDDFAYDLVVFGDVLEHMPEAEAKELWAKASNSAKYAIITIPIIHYPQGAEFGNPFEIHHEEDWNTERILKAFPGIVDHKEFSITGAYFAEFNR